MSVSISLTVDPTVVVTEAGEVITVVAEDGEPIVILAEPVGATGPQGPPGDASADLNYVHDQMAPASTWVVVHDLGKYPSVTVQDSAGSLCDGLLTYDSIDQLTLVFSAAFSGKAYLN